MKRKVLIIFFNKKEKSFHESSADIWGNFQKSLLKRKDVCMCLLSDCPSKSNFLHYFFCFGVSSQVERPAFPAFPKGRRGRSEMMRFFLAFLNKFLFCHYPPAVTLNCLHALIVFYTENLLAAQCFLDSVFYLYNIWCYMFANTQKKQEE